MKVKVLSIKQITTKDGNSLTQVFCLLDDGSIANFFTGKVVKIGDIITLEIGTDRNSKFVVRPVINS